MNKLVGEWVDE